MADRGSRQGGAGSHAGTWPLGGSLAAGRAPSRSGTWPAIASKLQTWARAETGAGRLLPWVPVAFGCGIALYFSADHEPVLAVAVSTALVFCLGAFLIRRCAFFPLVVLLAALACGFAIATWKTARIAHEVLA